MKEEGKQRDKKKEREKTFSENKQRNHGLETIDGEKNKAERDNKCKRDATKRLCKKTNKAEKRKKTKRERKREESHKMNGALLPDGSLPPFRFRKWQIGKKMPEGRR